MIVKHKNIEYFRTFFDVSQTIFSSLSLKDVLKLLVRKAVSTLGAKAGSLRLVNEKTNSLELAASYLLSKKYLNKRTLEFRSKYSGSVRGKSCRYQGRF